MPGFRETRGGIRQRGERARGRGVPGIAPGLPGVGVAHQFRDAALVAGMLGEGCSEQVTELVGMQVRHPW